MARNIPAGVLISAGDDRIVRVVSRENDLNVLRGPHAP
jgi:hypothetical protein